MENGELERALAHIAGLYGDVFGLQSKLTATRATGPENDGEGESAKACLIEGWLKDMGIADICHVDAPDARVPAKLRPNLIATIPGKSNRSLWLFAHMDVVPPGDLSLWKTDPWNVVQEGDVLYGRGVEDNQQGLVAMLLLTRALTSLQITPELTLRLVFMSDEECGNAMGLAWILKARPELFAPEDLYIVPDGGSPTGADIEIAEKSIFWLKVQVAGKQCHASTPQKDVNALVAASDAILALTGLAKDFSQKNELFDPPKSTFVPTRHEENVAGVNIMPGSDTFYVDCRLLPGIEPKDVLEKAKKRAAESAARRGVEITVEQAMLQPASQTPLDAPVVAALSRAIAATGITPKPMGMGGGTVAALLRHKGIPAAVWSTILNRCHEPNEHSLISATVKDAQIFARIALTPLA